MDENINIPKDGIEEAKIRDNKLINQLSSNTMFWVGTVLVVFGLVAFLGSMNVMSEKMANSLGFGAFAGVALTSIFLLGLIILTQAVGLGDRNEALGLPKGSVRAILALVLAIVFVAVSSWALGGMYGPAGQRIYSGSVTQDKLGGFDQKYPTSKYILTEEQSSKDQNVYSVEAFIRKDTQEITDLAKQIITISATVLVTVVGFYFGSKSASDAAQNASAAINSATTSLAGVQSSLVNAQGGGGANPPSATSSAGDAQKSASATAAIANGTQSKLASLGEEPMEGVRAAAQDPKNAQIAKTALASAEGSFQTLQARATTCASFADQAKQTMGANSPTGLNAGASNANIASMLSLATEANHDFEQAFETFVKARRDLLAPLAK